MKKEKSPILVIICILVLLIFIVLPPLFRKYIPKPEIDNSQVNKVSLKVLKCEKYFKEELYHVTSDSKYKNNQIDNNKIVYEKLQQVPEGVNNNTSITVLEEFNMFNTLNNVSIDINDTIATVNINQNLINSNPDNERLLNYFQPIEEQKSYYESMGYNCIIES